MANGIATSNILQPGAIAQSGGVNSQLAIDLQLLTPQFYKQYVQKYGDENFTWWLSTFGGMETVNNQNYFWFENRGKNQLSVTNANQASPAAGATVTLTLGADSYYNSGTESPLRVNETVRIASSNVEGVVLSINDATPNAFTFTVRPKQSTQAFVGSTGVLAAGEILLLAGDVDAGEASSAVDAQVHLDVKYSNNITQIRDDYAATDLAEMQQVFYDTGVTGMDMAGATQAGTSYFTYKALTKTNMRFNNNVEFKLMRGDIQNNTGLSGSLGSQGIIPKILADGETVTYSGGDIDLSKLHEITRVMDVNGCAKQNMWLMDVYQKQNFSDGIFKEFPAGAFVWGEGEKSEEASVAYGFKTIDIDGYRFQTKKYSTFNTEVVYGRTPVNDYFRNFGIICPMGESRDARDASKVYKNITIMQQTPQKGGFTSNGIRCWQWGGGSLNPTDGTVRDHVSMITYRGTRICSANQFLTVQAS
jgi:hypothetical protein